MKKSLKIIVSLLLILLCTGTVAVNGSTKSKKKTTKTTSTRLKSTSTMDGASILNDGFFFYSEGFYSASCLEEDLTNFGFKRISKTKTRTEYGEDYVNAIKEVYDGGNVTVTIVSYEDYPVYIDLKFSTTNDLNAFVRKMENDGWEYSYTHQGTKNYDKDPGGMYVNKRTVTLTYGG